MSIIKRPINSRRLRKAPPHGFGWIDHRLLSGGHLGRPGAQALGLYCLLVCAADHQGLSYYSEERLCALLTVAPETLRSARRALHEADLIAYVKPLYQVLAFDAENSRSRTTPISTPISTPINPPINPPASMAACPPVPRRPANPPLPPGLNLRAMVEASLREGGVL